MKLTKTPLLIALLFLPVVTVFVFDAGYSQLQKLVCSPATSLELSYACGYPERNEREKIVTTAFYRHVADYFGRSVGTSPSYLDIASNTDYQLKQRIGEFNRLFAISMILSIVAASVAGTLLTQECWSAYRHKKRLPAKS